MMTTGPFHRVHFSLGANMRYDGEHSNQGKLRDGAGRSIVRGMDARGGVGGARIGAVMSFDAPADVDGDGRQSAGVTAAFGGADVAGGARGTGGTSSGAGAALRRMWTGDALQRGEGAMAGESRGWCAVATELLLLRHLPGRYFSPWTHNLGWWGATGVNRWNSGRSG
jgi:hypothetical protein